MGRTPKQLVQFSTCVSDLSREINEPLHANTTLGMYSKLEIASAIKRASERKEKNERKNTVFSKCKS